jgi:hypothetical protein
MRTAFSKRCSPSPTRSTPDNPVIDLDRLRFRRMLDWSAHVVAQSLRGGTEFVT